MTEQRQFECPRCGFAMKVQVQHRMPGATRELTRNETLAAIVTTLREVAEDLPELSVPKAKVLAAIELLEALP